MWAEDEAGPYQTLPYPGQGWHPAAAPPRYPHEYVRQGTAKLLTLFHPASGLVRAKGVYVQKGVGRDFCIRLGSRPIGNCEVFRAALRGPEGVEFRLTRIACPGERRFPPASDRELRPRFVEDGVEEV